MDYKKLKQDLFTGLLLKISDEIDKSPDDTIESSMMIIDCTEKINKILRRVYKCLQDDDALLLLDVKTELLNWSFSVRLRNIINRFVFMYSIKNMLEFKNESKNILYMKDFGRKSFNEFNDFLGLYFGNKFRLKENDK